MSIAGSIRGHRDTAHAWRLRFTTFCPSVPWLEAGERNPHESIVNEREQLDRTGVAAEATDAIVATLSARLDALLASWQRTIQSEAKAAPKTENVKPRPAADVLTDLQRQINDLDLRIDTLRREVDIENQQAQDWEQRAMIALRDNREDVAKQALHEQQLHANAAASQESEVIELEAVRGAYRSAVAAVQASLEQ